MTTVTVRKATVADIPSLCALENECFSLPWSPSAFEDFFANGCSLCLAALYEDKIIGYVGMNLLAGEGEITNLAVTENFRRHGAASALIDALCQTDSVERLLLDVRVSNAAARALYEKHGFTVDGIRKNFYSKPREDAVLMSRTVSK